MVPAPPTDTRVRDGKVIDATQKNTEEEGQGFSCQRQRNMQPCFQCRQQRKKCESISGGPKTLCKACRKKGHPACPEGKDAQNTFSLQDQVRSKAYDYTCTYSFHPTSTKRVTPMRKLKRAASFRIWILCLFKTRITSAMRARVSCGET